MRNDMRSYRQLSGSLVAGSFHYHQPRQRRRDPSSRSSVLYGPDDPTEGINPWLAARQ